MDTHSIIGDLHGKVDAMEFQTLVTQVCLEFSDAFSAKQAQDWGRSYFNDLGPGSSITDLCIAGTLEFSMSGSLESLVERRLKILNQGRMSLDRIQRVCDLYLPPVIPDPVTLGRDLDLLRTFAVTGVPISVGEGFQPSSANSRFSRSYRQANLAVDAMLHESRLANLVLFLDPSCLDRLPGVHFQCLGWATKTGKAKGRSINDCSSVADTNGGTPLNTPDVTEWAESHFGKISHPTIVDILVMIDSVVQLHGLGNVVIWKVDISGAYTLLNFAVDCAKLMCFTMLSGTIVVYFTGNFGWTAMPAAFEVVTRVLRLLISSAIQGSCVMYVDDVMGCSPRSHFESDVETASGVIEGLLGPGSEARNKRESTLADPNGCVQCIGWEINLPHYTLDVSPRNRRKAIYCFFVVDTAKPVPYSFARGSVPWPNDTPWSIGSYLC